jgi:hypothetical protein
MTDDTTQPPPRPPQRGREMPLIDTQNQEAANQVVRAAARRYADHVAATSGTTFVPPPLLQPTPPPGSVDLSAVGITVGSPVIETPGLQEIPRPVVRTVVGKAVVLNFADIELLGWAFVGLLHERIETLKAALPNSDEAKAQIEELEDLKRRVEAFLNSASQFVTDKADEQAVVTTHLSFVDGLKNIWTRRHLQIADMTLFGIGVAICQMAAPMSVAVSGALVGGKTVVDAIKAALNRQ